MKKIFALFALIILSIFILASCSDSTGRSGKCLGSASDAIGDLDCREITIAMENVNLSFNYVVIETGNPEG